MAGSNPSRPSRRGLTRPTCWEPVFFRSRREWSPDRATVRDYVAANITLQRGVSGAKPETFCVWLFELLGMTPADEFTDLFPGSGAVSRAWEKWRNQTECVA